MDDPNLKQGRYGAQRFYGVVSINFSRLECTDWIDCHTKKKIC